MKRKKFVAVTGYAAFIGIVFVLMPSNPDEVTSPMELVNGFRAMSAVAVSVFWVSLAIILGAFWHKFRPDSEAKMEKH